MVRGFAKLRNRHACTAEKNVAISQTIPNHRTYKSSQTCCTTSRIHKSNTSFSLWFDGHKLEAPYPRIVHIMASLRDAATNPLLTWMVQSWQTTKELNYPKFQKYPSNFIRARNPFLFIVYASPFMDISGRWNHHFLDDHQQIWRNSPLNSSLRSCDDSDDSKLSCFSSNHSILAIANSSGERCWK